MIFWKKKSEKELKKELAMLEAKERKKARRRGLKSKIFKAKYGGYVKGAKKVGKGAVTVGKGLGKALDMLATPQKSRKKKKRKSEHDDFLDFDFGF